jgi:hypothetical protein
MRARQKPLSGGSTYLRQELRAPLANVNQLLHFVNQGDSWMAYTFLSEPSEQEFTIADVSLYRTWHCQWLNVCHPDDWFGFFVALFLGTLAIIAAYYSARFIWRMRHSLHRGAKELLHAMTMERWCLLVIATSSAVIAVSLVR